MTILTTFVNSYMMAALILIILQYGEIKSGTEFFKLLSSAGLISSFIGYLPGMITTLVIGNNSLKRMQPFLLT